MPGIGCNCLQQHPDFQTDLDYRLAQVKGELECEYLPDYHDLNPRARQAPALHPQSRNRYAVGLHQSARLSHCRPDHRHIKDQLSGAYSCLKTLAIAEEPRDGSVQRRSRVSWRQANGCICGCTQILECDH